MSKRWTKEDVDRIVNKKSQGTAKERHQALGRMKRGEMNATEKRYAEILDLRKRAGEVVEYWFDSLKLRLGDNCFYETDFLVLLASGEMEVVEVKGGWITDDGLVKFKAAQTMYPFRFRMLQWKKGEWIEK